jgi:hypothetical protein
LRAPLSEDLEGGEDPELDAQVVLPVGRVDQAVDEDHHEGRGRAPQQWAVDAGGAAERPPWLHDQRDEDVGEAEQAEQPELGPRREKDVVRVRLGDEVWVVGDVLRHRRLVGVDAGAEDRVVAQHPRGGGPDLAADVEGPGPGVERVADPGSDHRQAPDHKAGDERGRGEANPRPGRQASGQGDEDQRRQGEQSSAREGRQLGGQHHNQHSDRRPTLPAAAHQHETGGEADQRLEVQGDGVRVEVESGRGVAGDEAVPDDGPAEVEEVDGAEEDASDRPRREHQVDGGRRVDHGDHHIEDRDGLDEVRAKDAERAAVVRRHEHADGARHEEQRDRYLEACSSGQRSTIPDYGRDVEEDRQQDERLEQGGWNGAVVPADDVERRRRGGQRQRPARQPDERLVRAQIAAHVSRVRILRTCHRESSRAGRCTRAGTAPRRGRSCTRSG